MAVITRIIDIKEDTRYTQAAGRLRDHLHFAIIINQTDKTNEASKNTNRKVDGNANSPVLRVVKPSAIKSVCSQ
mgnify:CR=1 FL=1